MPIGASYFHFGNQVGQSAQRLSFAYHVDDENMYCTGFFCIRYALLLRKAYHLDNHD